MHGESANLLDRYVNEKSEAAFRELVDRYLQLVYSAAFRLTDGDAHLAEDVAQLVFIDLARLGRTFPKDLQLGGWLHRHTCFVASTVLRGERRRKEREKRAVEMNQQNESDGAAPACTGFLDEAVNQLGAEDRAAIVFRFFEGLSFRELALATGRSEAACQKRIERAIHKLQRLLARRGVTLSLGALGSMLIAQSTSAAPAGLALGITSAAFTAATQGITPFTALKFMVTTKARSWAAAALILSSVATPWIAERRVEAALRQRQANERPSEAKLVRATRDEENSAALAHQNGRAEQRDFEELAALRAQAAALTAEAQELPVLRKRLRDAGLDPTQDEMTVWQIQEAVMARADRSDVWNKAVLAYARAHGGMMPQQMEEARPFLPEDLQNSAPNGDSEYELMYRGSLTNLTGRELIFRERKLWPYGNEKYGLGKFGRMYGTADGSRLYSSSSDKTVNGSFETVEAEYRAPQNNP